jgi:hypothetical protein
VDEAGFDSRTHRGSVGYKQAFGRELGLRASYNHSDGEYEQLEGDVIPIVTRTADIGLTYEKRLSATRQVSISGGGGNSHVETLDRDARRPVDYWTPSGYGAVRVDVGRTWSVGADYRRSTSVLQGNTPEPFTSDTAQASIGGDLQPWLESVVTVGYANGASGKQSVENGRGGYDGYTGTVQLRIRMMSGWSSLVSFTHFQYRLDEETSQALGVARELHRNAVRIGLAWSLPLYTTNRRP